MKFIYDVYYFINKFTNIPENQWTIGAYSNPKGQRCAIGHLRGKDPSIPNPLEEHCLYEIMGDHPTNYVNDGFGQYSKLGESPKERILACLNQVKESNFR